MTNSLPYAWTNGAIWLLQDGTVIKIPGFHDEWIKSHQEQVPGCSNVCDVVLNQGWFSVVTYAGKYVELMIPNRRDERIIERVLRYLGFNLEHWDTALVMTMDEEGYFKIERTEFDAPAALRQRLLTDPLPA